jgi:hypothetical protein
VIEFDVKQPVRTTKMKGHMHPNHKHQNGSSNNSHNNNAGNIKEAERRLGAILMTVQKLSVSPDDLSRLMAVRKLTQNTARCRSCSRHVLPLMAALITVLMVLVMYSVEEQGLGCVKNTSVSKKQSDCYLVTSYRLQSM